MTSLAGRPDLDTTPGGLDRPVLHVGDETVTYGDLAVVAVLDGVWGPFLRRHRRASALRAAGHSSPEAAVAAAGKAFRYERRLLSGDEMRAWLADRGLDRARWSAHLDRWTLTSDVDDGADGPADPVDDPAVLDDAMISGLWSRAADTFIEWWAAERALGDGAPTDPPDDVPVLVALELDQSLAPHMSVERTAQLDRRRRCHGRLAERVVTDTALRRWLNESALSWTAVEATLLPCPSENVAREVRLCLTIDERPIDAVERDAGVGAQVVRTRASSLDAALSAALVSATPPEVVGPVPVGDSWMVAVLHDRRTPSLEDHEVREEAVRSIIDDVVRRTAAGLVREVGPL